MHFGKRLFIVSIYVMYNAVCKYNNAKRNCFLILFTTIVPGTIDYYFLTHIRPKTTGVATCGPPVTLWL